VVRGQLKPTGGWRDKNADWEERTRRYRAGSTWCAEKAHPLLLLTLCGVRRQRRGLRVVRPLDPLLYPSIRLSISPSPFPSPSLNSVPNSLLTFVTPTHRRCCTRKTPRW
jgi:hypothetical protein